MNAKRILAFVLSVLMVVSCVPSIIFAETGDEVNVVADTATKSNIVTIKMYDAEVTDANRYFGITNGGSFGAKFTLPSDHRLKQIRIHSVTTYGASDCKMHFYLYSGSTYGSGTLLNHVELPIHKDNSDLVINIGANEYYEGPLWFKIVKEGGKQAVSPVRANKSTNGTTYVNGNAVPFCLTIQSEPDLRQHAEANFVQHTTDDPIKTYKIQNHTDSSGRPKTDFKRPTDRGFLTIEGVGGDPFFEIGTLDAKLSTIPAHKMDYIVIKYRTSNVDVGRFFYSFSDSNGVGAYAGELSTAIDFDPTGEWETVIVHASVLSGRNDAVKNLRFDYSDGPTTDGKNPWMDIAYIRFFATPEAAQACVEAEEHSLVALPIIIRDYRADGMLFEYNAIDPDPKGYPDRIHGNNSAFSLTGLIGKFTSDMIQGQHDPEVREKFEELIGKDCPYLVNGTDSNTYQPEPDPTEVILNSGAKQNVYGAELRYDLVEPELGENGKPVYRQGVVEFIAWYLEKLLPVPETTDGKKNMNFIKGEADKAFDGKDLASYLRDKLVGKAQPGTYAETKARAKDLVGGQALDNIKTYMDAAYFLLHNTFVDNDGYGMTAEEYDTLNLVAKTDENGNVRYVFSTAYDNVIYDRVDGIIQNSQFEIATQRKLNGNTGDWYYHRGNKQPVGCFDPLFGLCYDVGGASREQDTYRKMLGNYDTYSENIYYKTANFHYTMEGHARFVYHYSENLYFTFIGDDDVYLYVNGKRIVDLGGTHPISKVVVNLNDVAEVCGLEEGGIYSFDFFYMERHGTAANLSIETNIRVADADMITEKKAYQKGQEVSFDGMVDHVLPVDYTFSIFNNGKVPFANMTFTDSDIGAALSYKAGEHFVLPQNVTADKLVLTKYKADGTVYGDVDGITGLTEEQIRQYLIQGLDVGERLTIGGFAYTIPEGKWIKQVDENGDAVKTYFVNHLHTTAIAKPNNVTEKVLKSTDYHRVNMAEYVFESMHVYDWGKLDGKKNDGSFKDVSIGVLVTSEDICDVMERHFGENYFQNRDLSFKLCSPSGNLQGGDLNKNVTVLSNGNFLYNNTKCGADTFYVTCLEDDIAYPPVRVDVYVYGVDDNIFVLDYNLPVTVNTQEQGLLANDILGLTTNPNAMNVKLEFSEFTNHYGDFNVIGEGGLNPSIVYTMKKFMNGVDIVDLKVTLYEEGTNDDPGKFNGVTMHQSVIFAPANVMYYEDDFTGNGAITYVNTGSDASGNIWAVYEGDKVGTEQSPDQTLNYGSDPNYAVNKTDIYNQLSLNRIETMGLGTATDKLLAEIGERNNLAVYGFPGFVDIAGTEHPGVYALNGDASNDTIHAISINSPNRAAIMSFDFYGTGFEIIGRTTMIAYGVLTVVIENLDEKGAVNAIPVITECVNGDLTQVPYVVRKNMQQGNYRVTVYTSNVNGADRMVYVDGVRIYQPLKAADAALCYKSDETAAEFHEIKTEILNGNVVYGQVLKGANVESMDNAALWHFGNTMIENYDADLSTNGNFVLKEIENDPALYMSYGPNNEIYLANTSIAENTNEAIFSYIAFYVEIDETYTGERSIQIGAHLKGTYDNIGFDSQSAEMIFGGKSEDFDPATSSNFTDKNNRYNVASGTEQYFNVDTCLTFLHPNGPSKALVIIGTKDLNMNVLALTNIKLNGYKLSTGNHSAAVEIAAVQDMSDVAASPLMHETARLAQALNGLNKD